MKNKLGIDQTAAWLLSFLVAGGIFAGIYYLFKKMAHKQEDFYSSPETQEHSSGTGHEEHSGDKGHDSETGEHSSGAHPAEVEHSPSSSRNLHETDSRDPAATPDQEEEDLDSEEESEPQGEPSHEKAPALQKKESQKTEHSSLEPEFDEEEIEEGDVKKVVYENDFTEEGSSLIHDVSLVEDEK